VTVEDPVVAAGTENPSRRRGGRSAVASLSAALRFASGTVAAGLLVLAAAVATAAVVSGDRPGPGVAAVAGHAAVAVAALTLQVIADRRRGPIAALAALLVFPLAAATLWFWWWN